MLKIIFIISFAFTISCIEAQSSSNNFGISIDGGRPISLNQDYVVFTRKRPRTHSETETERRPNECIINFGIIRETEPIFLNPDYSFMIPNGDSKIIPSHASFILDCGESRLFEHSHLQQTVLTCMNGAFLNETNHQIYVNTLRCSEASAVSSLVRVRSTFRNCGREQSIYEVGFNVIDFNYRQQFIPVYSSCFNFSSKSVSYVESQIYGTVQREGSVTNTISLRHWNDGAGIDTYFFGTKVQEAYSEQRMDRGHLAANADYSFAPMRKATHTYFNMVPMDGNVNQRIWSRLERDVFQFVKQQRETATIYTGGFSVNNRALTLNRCYNILNRRSQSILRVTNIPTILIPDTLWKIVNIDDSGLVVGINANGGKITNYCIDLCPARAYSCCNVNEFIRNVNNAGLNLELPAHLSTLQNFNHL